MYHVAGAVVLHDLNSYLSPLLPHSSHLHFHALTYVLPLTPGTIIRWAYFYDRDSAGHEHAHTSTHAHAPEIKTLDGERAARLGRGLPRGLGDDGADGLPLSLIAQMRDVVSCAALSAMCAQNALSAMLSPDSALISRSSLAPLLPG